MQPLSSCCGRFVVTPCVSPAAHASAPSRHTDRWTQGACRRTGETVPSPYVSLSFRCCPLCFLFSHGKWPVSPVGCCSICRDGHCKLFVTVVVSQPRPRELAPRTLQSHPAEPARAPTNQPACLTHLTPRTQPARSPASPPDRRRWSAVNLTAAVMHHRRDSATSPPPSSPLHFRRRHLLSPPPRLSTALARRNADATPSPPFRRHAVAASSLQLSEFAL